MNLKLLELYHKKYIELSIKLNEYNESKINPKNRATNPLLLAVDDKWENSDYRVMIFGQDNNFWAGECGIGNPGNEALFCGKIEDVIQIYHNFYLANDLRNKQHNSPYWNEFKRIKNHLETNNNNVSVLWNNVVKIGRLGCGNVPRINEISKNHFDVILDEIKILKPDFLIFFTGPDYDNLIKDYFGEFSKVKINNFDTRELCVLEFQKELNIKKAIRSYHPNYLYRNKLRKTFIDQIFHEISIFNISVQ